MPVSTGPSAWDTRCVRKGHFALRAWLLASVVFAVDAAAVAFETERTADWSTAAYVPRIIAAVVAAAGAVALLSSAEEAEEIVGRWVLAAAAAAFATSAVAVFAFVRLWRAARADSLSGADVGNSAAFAIGVFVVAWFANAVGVVLVAVVVHAIARNAGRARLAYASLASAVPIIVGVVIKIGTKPWSSFVFAVCAVVSYGTLSFVAYRLLADD